MTEESVGKMQIALEELKPQLVIKSQEVDEQAKVVEAESAIAEKEQEKVEAETAIAQVSADKTEAIKLDCQKDLDEALPALDAAAKALNGIQQKDVAELRTIKKFHDDVMRVFKGVCVLLGFEPVKQMNNETQKREENWEIPAKKLLADIGFLKSLQNYEKDNMDAKKIDRIQPFITHENCTVAHLKGINAVASSLCAWVLAMDKYYRVSLVVKPKKESLAIAEKEYAELNSALNEKKENLRIVQERVARLQAQLKAAQDEKR